MADHLPGGFGGGSVAAAFLVEVFEIKDPAGRALAFRDGGVVVSAACVAAFGAGCDHVDLSVFLQSCS